MRPTSGGYIEAAIGGTGSEVGFGGGVGGVAPVDDQGCKPIGNAVVFIFAANQWLSSAQTACEVTAQESGHSIVPLDHELLASDPMTYLDYNGHKVFQDQDAKCGESSPRERNVKGVMRVRSGRTKRLRKGADPMTSASCRAKTRAAKHNELWKSTSLGAGDTERFGKDRRALNTDVEPAVSTP